jgi:branched-chain amino acid transport system substrate-binding protein
MKKLLWIIVLIIIIAVIVVLANERSPRANDEAITIGAIMVTSGDAAFWGEAGRKGVEMAVDDFKAEHGATVNLVMEDSRGEGKIAVSAFQKLTSLDQVDGIVGPLLQSEVDALAPVIAQSQIPVVAPSYSAVQNRPNPRNPLVVWMDAQEEAYRIADYVYDQGARTVGIIGTLDSWEQEVSNAFAARFTERGGQVLAKELVAADSADVRLPVTRVVNTRPDALFFGTAYQFVNATKAASDLRYSGKTYSIEIIAYLAEETKGYTNGLIFIAPDFYRQEFATRFQERFGEQPSLPAGQAYDATMILLETLRDTETPAEAIQKLAAIKEYDGASGEVTFTDDNRTFLPTAFFRLQNGEITKIE